MGVTGLHSVEEVRKAVYGNISKINFEGMHTGIGLKMIRRVFNKAHTTAARNCCELREVCPFKRKTKIFKGTISGLDDEF